MSTIYIKTQANDVIEDMAIETRYIIGDWAVHPAARAGGLDSDMWTVTYIPNGLQLTTRYSRKLALFIAVEVDALNADFTGMTERYKVGEKPDKDKAVYNRVKIILEMYDDDDYGDE